MYTLKEKVAGSLSRLFADSPSHSSPSSAPDLSQARSKGSKSVLSMFSNIIPSLGYGESKLGDNGSDLKPVRSQPVRWKSKKLAMHIEVPHRGKEYTPACTTEELKRTCEDEKKIWTDGDNKQMVRLSPHSAHKDHFSERSSTDSEDFHEAREQQTPRIAPPKLFDEFQEAREEQTPRMATPKLSDEFQEAREEQTPRKAPLKLSDESMFINYDLHEFLVSSLPNIVKGCQWTLVYSTLKHGISLRTLIRRSAELPGPCLLITGDRQGAVFGVMLECPLIPTPKRKYQVQNREQTRRLYSLPNMVNQGCLDQPVPIVIIIYA